MNGKQYSVGSEQEIYPCLICERSEMDVPLLALRYRGEPGWICSQCLPKLIHQPQQLAGKLANVDGLIPVPIRIDNK